MQQGIRGRAKVAGGWVKVHLGGTKPRRSGARAGLSNGDCRRQPGAGGRRPRPERFVSTAPPLGGHHAAAWTAGGVSSAARGAGSVGGGAVGPLHAVCASTRATLNKARLVAASPGRCPCRPRALTLGVRRHDVVQPLAGDLKLRHIGVAVVLRLVRLLVQHGRPHLVPPAGVSAGARGVGGSRGSADERRGDGEESSGFLGRLPPPRGAQARTLPARAPHQLYLEARAWPRRARKASRRPSRGAPGGLTGARGEPRLELSGVRGDAGWPCGSARGPRGGAGLGWVCARATRAARRLRPACGAYAARRCALAPPPLPPSCRAPAGRQSAGRLACRVSSSGPPVALPRRSTADVAVRCRLRGLVGGEPALACLPGGGGWVEGAGGGVSAVGGRREGASSGAGQDARRWGAPLGAAARPRRRAPEALDPLEAREVALHLLGVVVVLHL
jgi:hypothetical protein